MKHLVVIALVALVAAGLAIAAVARPRAAHHPPTTASLMPAYVQAAKYWLAPRKFSTGVQAPPTTASLLPAYVQAAKVGRW